MQEILAPLKAVSEGIRVRLLLILKDREACVCELMSVFGMAQSKLSHHLISLRDAGFLQAEKRGKWNYYRVDKRSLKGANRDLLVSLARWADGDPVFDRDRKALNDVQERMRICCKPVSENPKKGGS